MEFLKNKTDYAAGQLKAEYLNQVSNYQFLHILHDHLYYHVCPDILSLVCDPLPGNGCGSLNHTYI